MNAKVDLVERFIGSGAYGRVVLLESAHEKKVIKYLQCENEVQRKNYENEVKALEKLIHPNIVGYIGSITEEGQFGIEMEYCERGSLEKLIYDRTIIYSIDSILWWTEHLFNGLSFLYSSQRVHRDIKPDNILVKQSFLLKIGDFGCVKDTQVTCTGSFVGTMRYMSPPQIDENPAALKSESLQVSHKNDIYSMGLVLWELVERKKVFSDYNQYPGFDHNRFLMDIIRKKVVALEEATCQSELKELIKSCTNFDRSSRPLASEIHEQVKAMIRTVNSASPLDYLPLIEEKQRKLIRPVGFNGAKDRIAVNVDEESMSMKLDASWGSGPLNEGSTHSKERLDGEAVGATLKAANKDEELTLRERLQELLMQQFDQLQPAKKDEFLGNVPKIYTKVMEKHRVLHEIAYIQIHDEKARLLMQGQDVRLGIEEIFERLIINDFCHQAITIQAIGAEDRGIGPSNRFYPFRALMNIFASILHLTNTRLEKHFNRLHAECYISSLTGKEWLLWTFRTDLNEAEFRDKDDLSTRVLAKPVDSNDKTAKIFLPLQNRVPSTGKIQEVDVKVPDLEEKFHYDHLHPLDYHNLRQSLDRVKELEINRLKLRCKSYVPLLYSFERTQALSFPGLGEDLPISGYTFQLRNPPRVPCQGSCKPHPNDYIGLDFSGRSWHGDVKRVFSNPETRIAFLNQELKDSFDVCKSCCLNQEAVHYLRLYFEFTRSIHLSFQMGKPLLEDSPEIEVAEPRFEYDYFILSLVPNIWKLGKRQELILLDHPMNYKKDERMLCFDLDKKLYSVEAPEMDRLLKSIHPVDRKFFRTRECFQTEPIGRKIFLFCPYKIGDRNFSADEVKAPVRLTRKYRVEGAVDMNYTHIIKDWLPNR